MRRQFYLYPVAVPCPKCGAQAGYRCGKLWGPSHRERHQNLAELHPNDTR